MSNLSKEELEALYKVQLPKKEEIYFYIRTTLFNSILVKKPIEISDLSSDPHCYALMVTGEEGHLDFAINAVLSFYEQSWEKKKMIIINNGSYNVLKNLELSDEEAAIIHEVKIDYNEKDTKHNLNQLKNIGLDNVPNGNFWIQWNDDTYHSPNRMKLQMGLLDLKKFRANVLMNQIKFNVLEDKSFAYTSKTGLLDTICSYKMPFKYPYNTNEYSFIYNYNWREYIRGGAKGWIQFINNQPSDIIRLYLENNKHEFQQTEQFLFGRDLDKGEHSPYWDSNTIKKIYEIDSIR